MRTCYVYILSSQTRTLYVGVTSDLSRRMAEHRAKIGSRFAAKYNVTRLVHVESFDSISEAIIREKQIKGWRRSKKLALIRMHNPRWRDLADEP
ncbi:MAG: GIY-YIG nuclease family protein [Rhodothermales bacterium]|nr:GIY-YIG nuclease family protein [Rhodothermales bacterium]